MNSKRTFLIFNLFCNLFLVSGIESALNGVNSESKVPEELWEPIWSWKCIEDTVDGPSCQRQPWNKSDTVVTRVPLNICWLTCGTAGPLWPLPTGNTVLGKKLTAFLPSNFIVGSMIPTSGSVRDMLNEAFKITLGHIFQTYNVGIESSNPDRQPDPSKIANEIEIHLEVKDSSISTIKLEIDESYSLNISQSFGGNDIQVFITGNTYFGVRHGLETLTELIAFNEDEKLLEIVNTVEIVDKPVFRYRGLMIDTGRNFIPIPHLKRMVDAMAYNKLNMFHWHLSDSNSIPFLSKREPKVTKYGMMSPLKVYTPEEITEFIRYANIRGIKIIPELDGPSHAGNGWQWGPEDGLGDLSLCVNAEPYSDYCIQPPCGQLNPLNGNTLRVLGNLFKDFFDVFDRDLFHMGNDEIAFKCWLKYAEINDWLIAHNTTDLMDLWGMFQQKALLELKNANVGIPVTPIVWTSDMTDTLNGRKFLHPDDYVIQIWSVSNETSIKGILEDSYRVIFSNKDVVYLDHGYGPWRNLREQSKLNLWQELYNYDILALVNSTVGAKKTEELFNSGKLFGGEACLWSEKADQHNMEMKLWPRGAALAERLWSNPAGKNVDHFAYPRLILHRERMITRGVRPDTLLPEACHQIWGFCDDGPNKL